jgi:putative intracellular protease/amidase
MDRVVDDVLERVVVLVLRFDHPRPEPSAEDVVLAAVTFIEGTGVLAVEVAHPVGEVCERGLDEQVVVVPQQAAGMEPPAVAPSDALQDLDEDRAIPVVLEDRRVVVALGSDVVVGAGGQVPVLASHRSDRNGGPRPGRPF